MTLKRAKVDGLMVSDRLRITINRLLHLSLDVSQLVAVQSWKYGNYRFVIEFTFKTTRIESMYTSRQLWEDILNKLAEFSLV